MKETHLPHLGSHGFGNCSLWSPCLLQIKFSLCDNSACNLSISNSPKSELTLVQLQDKWNIDKQIVVYSNNVIHIDEKEWKQPAAIKWMNLGLLGCSVGWASNFSSGHDLTVHEFEPCIRLCADSSEPGAYFRFCVSLCPFTLPLIITHTLSLKIVKTKQNKTKKLRRIFSLVFLFFSMITG